MAAAAPRAPSALAEQLGQRAVERDSDLTGSLREVTGPVARPPCSVSGFCRVPLVTVLRGGRAQHVLFELSTMPPSASATSRRLLDRVVHPKFSPTSALGWRVRPPCGEPSEAAAPRHVPRPPGSLETRPEPPIAQPDPAQDRIGHGRGLTGGHPALGRAPARGRHADTTHRHAARARASGVPACT